MPQTLLFPTDKTDKGVILDAGANTSGGLTVDGKPVCMLGSMATHPQGPDTLLFHSGGITLDGVPLALSGGSTALAGQQLPSMSVAIEVIASSTATGNPLSPNVIGQPIIKYEKDTLASTYAHNCFIQLAQNTNEYFWCWYFLDIFGAGPGIEAYQKLYKEAKNGQLKNPPLTVVSNDMVKPAGYGLLHHTIYVNKKTVLRANQPLEQEVPDSALVNSAVYDKSIWLTRVRLLAALIEEYGEYIYDHLWTLAGKKYTNAGYDAGATYAFGIMGKLLPNIPIPIAQGTVDGQPINIKLDSTWWANHIDEIKQANQGEQARSEDGETMDKDGEIIKDFGEGEGDIEHNLFTHGGIEKKALAEVAGRHLKPKQIDQIYYGNWLRDNSQGIDRMLLNIGKKINGGAGIRTMNMAMTELMGMKGMKEFLLKDLVDSYNRFYGGAKTLVLPADLNSKDFLNAQKLIEYISNYKRAFKDFYTDYGDYHTYLGCYRSDEHLDNPHLIEYADTLTNYVSLQPENNFSDATGCWFLQLNTNWGMKNYLRSASQQPNFKIGNPSIGEGTLPTVNALGKPTLTGYRQIVNQLKIACAHPYSQKGYIALGSAMHTLQDYYAHSNYCELSLIKLGQHRVFPWVSTLGLRDWELNPKKQLNYVKNEPTVRCIKQFVTAYYIDTSPPSPLTKPTSPNYSFNPWTSTFGENPGYHPANFLQNYQPNLDPGFVIDKTDYTKNKYPNWLERDDYLHSHVNTADKCWYILQEISVYSDGTYDMMTFQRVSVFTEQPIPLPTNASNILREVTVFSGTYHAHKLPVVTGKFGSLDTVHSIVDIITEHLQPAAFWDNAMDSIIDTIKDAAKENFKTDVGKSTYALFEFFKNIDTDDINFPIDYLADILTKFATETHNADLSNVLSDFKTNLLIFKQNLVDIIKFIQTVIKSNNFQQLEKTLVKVHTLLHLKEVLKDAIAKLLPVFKKYLWGCITQGISDLVVFIQKLENQLAIELKSRNQQRGGTPLISDAGEMEYGLYTNPTHSQLAKDSRKAPTHILAGNLAVFATKKLGDAVVNNMWNNIGFFSNVEQVVNQLLTHPMDITNGYILEMDEITRQFIKDYPEKIKEASNVSIKKWIVEMFANIIEAVTDIHAAIKVMGNKIIETMHMVETTIKKAETTIKTSIDEMDKSMHKMKEKLKDLQEEYKKQLKQKIIDSNTEINKELKKVQHFLTTNYPFRESNSQSLTNTNAYKLAGQISRYEKELAELEKLDLDRYAEVLPKWYERKYNRRNQTDISFGIGFA